MTNLIQQLRELKEVRDLVTKDCKDKDWSLWGTGCLYAGNYCLVRKGRVVEHEKAWDDAQYFILYAANFPYADLLALVEEMKGRWSFMLILGRF